MPSIYRHKQFTELRRNTLNIDSYTDSSNETKGSTVSRMMVFSGSANPELAKAVTERLDIPMGDVTLGKFSDGEIAVELNENVRGADVFIIQPTCAPTNDHLMELIFLADALRRASAGRITAVVPYFGYARQDRRTRSARVPISAKAVADMLTVAGIDRILTVDLHADQIQGFFSIPVDNIYGSPIMLDDIAAQDYENLMVVSPDVGGVVRARAIAKQLNEADLAIIDKRRAKANQAEVMHIIGDVKDRTCVLVDDMVDTAGTLCHAAEALIQHGAKKVVAYATHPVLSGPALDRISNAQLELVVTDTIPLSPEAAECANIRQLSMAGVLAEAMRRVSNEESISAMFR
jgi:ribose-phosphate pyrophosphokinase